MTASTTAPADRPAHIHTLINSVDCHLLEDYLQDQLSSSSYDLLSNLALLKLYQFNPSLLSPTASLQILFLALAHAPFSPDFSLAWSLLSDSFIVGAALPLPPLDDDDDEDDRREVQPRGEKETAEKLKTLSGLLQARKFKAFWAALRTDEDKQVAELVDELVKSASGFEGVLRSNIAKEVEASFKGIARKTLESFLGLEPNADAVLPIIEANKWTLDGAVVHIPANESNAPTSTLQREHIEIQRAILHISQALPRYGSVTKC
ncbi:translation initiation factor eIF-3 subunit 12 [Pseudohyphozyma bogoriensis]|nr:translation initiation factor eIF-3 subunit 12 [Pseudohyphozyma bogoriensis]